MGNSDSTHDSEDRVSFRVTPGLREEIEKASQLLGGEPDEVVFSRGFTLLRVILGAYEAGKEVYIQDSLDERSRIQIPGYTLPRQA